MRMRDRQCGVPQHYPALCVTQPQKKKRLDYYYYAILKCIYAALFRCTLSQPPSKLRQRLGEWEGKKASSRFWSCSKNMLDQKSPFPYIFVGNFVNAAFAFLHSGRENIYAAFMQIKRISMHFAGRITFQFIETFYLRQDRKKRSIFSSFVFQLQQIDSYRFPSRFSNQSPSSLIIFIFVWFQAFYVRRFFFRQLPEFNMKC